MILSAVTAFFFMGSGAFADEPIEVPTVVFDAQENRPQGSSLDRNALFKTERISSQVIRQSQRQNLSEIVRDQVGVDSQEYCANCGAKRLTINGLRGEHTSILVDGLPLHSAVSSFYGVDNIPAIGLTEVQVMRGTGASLTNPEAIGGTLNLITVDPLQFDNSYNTSVGVDDQFSGKSQNHNFLIGYTGKKKRFGAVLGGQLARLETWDEDQNGVAEAPHRQTYSVMGKTRFSLGRKNDFSLRMNLSALELLGGPANPLRPTRVRRLRADGDDFVDGNVEKEFIGDPFRITDWVKTQRSETALSGTHFLRPTLTMEWKLGHARQTQDSIYQHGFDYANVDNIVVGDVNLKSFTGANSIFTVGGFFKDQRLRSASETLFVNSGIASDSFDFSSYALYGQWTYFRPDIFELDVALRSDLVNINWLDLTNEIKNKPVLAPRVQLLHHLSSHWQQRLSYGYGYRAPLTFFESQHGNNESGYKVDIERLERSHSIVYSLSWNTPKAYLTGGLHYTHLQNMAYGFESEGFPILYRNSPESFDIGVTDLLGGYKITPWWLIEGSVEFFFYEDLYKRRLPTAAIEQRYQLKSSIDKGRWTQTLFFNFIGARNLSPYASYDEHFVVRNDTDPDLNPNLERKDQRSPFYFTLDASLTYELYKSLSLSFSVINMFDFTQARRGDTPSAWHWHFNHAHYDALHTWGPNRGRQFLFGLSGQL